MKKLIFGCGYLGARVARLWLDQGAEVTALTRSPQRAEQFSQQGIAPLVGDLAAPDSLPQLPEADTVLFAVGYDRQSGVPLREVYVEGLRRVLTALPRSVKRFIYISSTGVYGQNDGGWVDEQAPCLPTREGGKACLEAEALLAESDFADRVIVLRLAGIYGPGRIPRRSDLMAGKPIAAAAEGFLNLIHVEDAARIVLQAEQLPAGQKTPAPRLYLTSDGSPAVRGDYYRYLAELLQAPPPQFVSPDTDSHAAARAAADKRISNRLLMSELGISLKYPSYREGLAAIVNEQEN